MSLYSITRSISGDSAARPTYSPGLAGVVAGETSIATVGSDGGQDLLYRGYSIQDLVGKLGFEEVAYLVTRGELPDQVERDEFTRRNVQYRLLPQPLRNALHCLPKTANIMVFLQRHNGKCVAHIIAVIDGHM